MTSAVLPPWFKQKIPDQETIGAMKASFRQAGLSTVCESARCPNMGQCWSRGTATFMILGDVCTRACRFCAVDAGRPGRVDAGEPREVARAVARMNLKYVVITSVARDDLPDEGAGHFAQVIEEVRRQVPDIKIEVLVPDFSGREENLRILAAARPEVISHNMETVRRLSKEVRSKAQYDRSLYVLRRFKELAPEAFIKSGFMVGLGETGQEVEALMRDLLETGCEILTIGQYLRPTQARRHLPVVRYVSPDEFRGYRERGMGLGFKHVMSGPLVRSSYIAEEGYYDCLSAHATT